MRDRIIDALCAAIVWDTLARLLHHRTLSGDIGRAVTRLWRTHSPTSNVCWSWRLFIRDVSWLALGLMALGAGIGALWHR